ncbi:MAG TPA: hypothetical protein VN461_11885 [Vicinamibacteria bacterium]|jgi:hypothetical protein|nr:hypothetical protein [Vicinamibacteria bacterium]
MHTVKIASWSTGLALVLTSTAWAQAPQPKAQTATQFYVAYRAAFDKATKVDDLFPFMAAKNLKQVQATPAADREKMFGMMKIMGALTELKVTKEERTPEGGALLTAEGLAASLSDAAKKEKQAGKITIVKEGGAWKLDREEWH